MANLVTGSALEYTRSLQYVEEDGHHPLEKLRVDWTGRIVVQTVTQGNSGLILELDICKHNARQHMEVDGIGLGAEP